MLAKNARHKSAPSLLEVQSTTFPETHPSTSCFVSAWIVTGAASPRLSPLLSKATGMVIEGLEEGLALKVPRRNEWANDEQKKQHW